MVNKMELDGDIVNARVIEVESNTSSVLGIIDRIVLAETEALDNIMKDIHDNIIDADYPDTALIEKYFLELSNCLYFMAERVEKLGMWDAVGKIQYKETYNNAYMNPNIEKAKPTVAELTALAEGASTYDQVASEIYSKAYKIIKGKIDAADTMISTLSKLVSKRISEMQLSGIQPANPERKTLNEGQVF